MLSVLQEELHSISDNIPSAGEYLNGKEAHVTLRLVWEGPCRKAILLVG
jgi:hypothetical protein